MSAPPELDSETKARLRWEAERLAAEQEISLQEARQIVWLDYQEELAAHSAATPPSPMETPEPIAVEVPGPEPPVTQERDKRGFWDARKEPALTQEWLERNKAELAKVKQLVGLRK
ncbi:hypothetical protein QF022_002380 [Vogesella perlucida]|nr:hypothetical protein [Vogesella perlucida]